MGRALRSSSPENTTATMRLNLTTGAWDSGPAWTPQRADFGLASDGSHLYAMGGDTPGGSYFDSTNAVNELDLSAWPGGSWVASPPDLPQPPRQANQAGFYTTGLTGGEIWSTGGINGATFQFLPDHLYRSTSGGPPPPPPPPPPPGPCNSTKVLLAYADIGGTPDNLTADLLAEPGVTQVDQFDAFSGTPTLSQLEDYKVVVPFSNNGWFDANAMGDVLADYLDAGGVVVGTTFNWDNRGPWLLQGRYMNGGYTPFDPTSGTAFSNASLGSFNAGHPIMQGITTLNAFYRNTVTLASGADLVASWDDGNLLIAAKGRTVAINAYLGYLNAWSGQFAHVITNSADWIGC
jgi:hypothetical protein